MQVSPQCGKWWRFKYRFAGKEKCWSLGVYPRISLADARAHHGEMVKLLAKGIDPQAAREARKAEQETLSSNTFEIIAREWFARQQPGWAEGHYDRGERAFERDIFLRG
ncbi:MAG: integrase [Gammaproteobacteria bacterium]|nr:integrase [Gammaproteobacteria bacterium]